MTLRTTLGEHLPMGCFCSVLYSNDYKNKTNMKVVANNINMKIHQLFSEQRILGVCASIVQRKISGDLTQTYF